MSDTPLPLSPDDGHQEHLTLTNELDSPGKPYAWSALLVFVATLLLVHFLLGMVRPFIAISFAFLLGLLNFIICELTHPRINVLTLTLFSAELGMILGQPALRVADAFQGDIFNAILLGFWMLLAGLIGWMAARTLDARRYPTLVPPIAFLLMFVLTGIWHLVK